MISQTVTQLIALGAGAIVVPLTSLIKQKGWDVRLKFVISALMSFLASLGISIPTDVTNTGYVNYGATAATVFATAQVLYKLIFAGTRTEDKLASVGSGGALPRDTFSSDDV